MRLDSIYEHMIADAGLVPEGSSCKLVLRHSIRYDIKPGMNPDEASLTPEGRSLAAHFGRGLDYAIGFVGSSDVGRCMDTAEAVVEGFRRAKGLQEGPRVVGLPEGLKTSHAADERLCAETFGRMEPERILEELRKGTSLPGVRPPEQSVKLILDTVFSFGSAPGTADLFFTHDIHIALLAASLFGFCGAPWPMMLEGLVFWGTRESFRAAWREKTGKFDNYLISRP